MQESTISDSAELVTLFLSILKFQNRQVLGETSLFGGISGQTPVTFPTTGQSVPLSDSPSGLHHPGEPTAFSSTEGRKTVPLPQE
jgi:hypothetical protein